MSDTQAQQIPDDGLFADLVPANTLIAENPELFTRGRLDWIVRARHWNGAAKAGAVLVVQRRAFFHRKKLLAWLQSQDKTD